MIVAYKFPYAGTIIRYRRFLNGELLHERVYLNWLRCSVVRIYPDKYKVSDEKEPMLRQWMVFEHNGKLYRVRYMQFGFGLFDDRTCGNVISYGKPNSKHRLERHYTDTIYAQEMHKPKKEEKPKQEMLWWQGVVKSKKGRK